jgi:calcineurin-like phosphoesterase family protein
MGDGRFSFNSVEAAKFILSAQLAGSEMIFFPGTHDASKTEIIEAYDASRCRGYPFVSLAFCSRSER